MAQYKGLMLYSDGTKEIEDDVFDTEKAGEEYGCYLVAAEPRQSSLEQILNMSSPEDYPMDDFEDPDFEVVEIDD